MNHIHLIRLVVLKRHGFQSPKYGMPTPESNICEKTNTDPESLFNFGGSLGGLYKCHC